MDTNVTLTEGRPAFDRNPRPVQHSHQIFALTFQWWEGVRCQSTEHL